MHWGGFGQNAVQESKIVNLVFENASSLGLFRELFLSFSLRLKIVLSLLPRRRSRREEFEIGE
jgi:hypothetical protein